MLVAIVVVLFISHVFQFSIYLFAGKALDPNNWTLAQSDGRIANKGELRFIEVSQGWSELEWLSLYPGQRASGLENCILFLFG